MTESTPANPWTTLLFHKVKNYTYGVKKCTRSAIFAAGRFLMKIILEIHAMEQVYIKLPGIYSLSCQLLFFVMCDIALNEPLQSKEKNSKKLVTGLTSLLFYSVVGYFSSRVKDICDSDYGRSRGRTRYGNYLKWILKIILEWSKALTVAICLREQGIHYHPRMSYGIVTFIYYLCTEKIFVIILQKLVACLNIEALDTFEHLYVPIFLNIYVLAASVAISWFLIQFTPYAIFAICASYFTVYLRLKDLIFNYVRVLNLEKRTFASFKAANEREIERWNDICAVCLNSMSRARITPCNHFFHPHCLKQCLQVSFQCPLCKRCFLGESNSS